MNRFQAGSIQIEQKTSESFVSIQCLRGVAAFLVVVTHALGGGHLKFPDSESALISFYYLKDFCASGVDIFFVISGFVMVYANRNSFGERSEITNFIARRAIRILPLYWIFSTVMLALLLVAPSLLSILRFQLPHAVESFLLIPTVNSNGEFYPMLNVGWTLTYEMYFYFIFGLLLWGSMLGSIATTTIVFSASVVIGLFIEPKGPVAYMLTNQLLLEFLLGEYIALFLIRGNSISRPAAWLLLAGVAVVYILHLVFGPLNAGRFFYRGLPGAALIFSALFVELNGFASFPKVLKHLGDSSYSLYLTHTLTIATFFKCYSFLPASFRLPLDVVIVGGVVFAVLMAHLIYVAMERPITRFLNQVWRKMRQTHLAQPA
jgi:exopolysaccharide production protein ExoZ